MNNYIININLYKYSVMKHLLQKSCRAHVEDKKGNTPLHLCCENGHHKAVEILLLYQYGFDFR